MEEKTREKYVKWYIFCWAIGIMTLVIGWSFVAQAQLGMKVDSFGEQSLEIRTQLSQIQADLGWIREAIKEK